MKHFLFFILSVSFALGTFAQELKIKSCTLASTDVTASSLENIRMDDVGDPCALVKILLLDGISKVRNKLVARITLHEDGVAVATACFAIKMRFLSWSKWAPAFGKHIAVVGSEDYIEPCLLQLSETLGKRFGPNLC